MKLSYKQKISVKCCVTGCMGLIHFTVIYKTALGAEVSVAVLPLDYFPFPKISASHVFMSTTKKNGPKELNKRKERNIQSDTLCPNYCLLLN